MDTAYYYFISKNLYILRILLNRFYFWPLILVYLKRYLYFMFDFPNHWT